MIPFARPWRLVRIYSKNRDADIYNIPLHLYIMRFNTYGTMIQSYASTCMYSVQKYTLTYTLLYLPKICSEIYRICALAEGYHWLMECRKIPCRWHTLPLRWSWVTQVLTKKSRMYLMGWMIQLHRPHWCSHWLQSLEQLFRKEGCDGLKRQRLRLWLDKNSSTAKDPEPFRQTGLSVHLGVFGTWQKGIWKLGAKRVWWCDLKWHRLALETVGPR